MPDDIHKEQRFRATHLMSQIPFLSFETSAYITCFRRCLCCGVFVRFERVIV